MSLSFIACDKNDVYPPIEDTTPKVTLTKGSADFTKYVSVGASFTAGFTDGALFKASQENSFPNILASKFAMAGGGEFNQPMMNDNIGGLLLGGNVIQGPRLYFNGAGPAVLDATPTTEITTTVTTTGNFGVPGAKSFHLLASGYGNAQGVALGLANPYYVRFASSPTATVIGDVIAQSPTFFTLSEIGGNDVLSYALAGGSGVDQTGNFNPATYGGADITDPNVFAQTFSGMVDVLTANGAKGAVATVPYITSLAHFTTVPYNPLNPKTNAAFAAQIPTLNTVFGALNAVFTHPGINQPNRVITFSDSEPNAVVIKDENLPDLKNVIVQVLMANPQFPVFVQQFGLPAAAAPLVANLLGTQYGQTRQATAEDLFVLPSSTVIGTVNTNSVQALMAAGLPQALAGQFSVEGVTLPLADKWVLTPQEQTAIKTATDAYNATITSVAEAKGLALVDFKAILEKASTTGIQFDSYSMTTNLVTGGLISLDGVHLTGRGYALMANEILKAIDAKYSSNFESASNGLAKAKEYPTNYSPALR